MLDAAGIPTLLPHGHPMVLVDRVVTLVPGSHIVALKAVTRAEPCYSGMGAGSDARAWAYPISLLIESFGQAAALLWLSDRPASTRYVPMLASMRGFRVESRAYPGEVLQHTAR